VNVVARFENFIERLMERTFTRATGSHLQPVEIGKRVVRAMEVEQSVGMEGVLVPNMYNVYLSPDDYGHFEAALGSMSKNLESHLGRVARQRGYHMMSRPVVQLRLDKELNAGDLLVEAHLEDVQPVEPTSAQHTSILPQVDAVLPSPSARAGTPSLMWGDQSFAVLRSPTRMGRLPDNDIVFNDKRVSRHHAEVVENSGRWVLRDIGSTNGTAVNGKVLRETLLKPGDTISLGGLEVTWEQ
jgi:hypothetical protein